MRSTVTIADTEDGVVLLDRRTGRYFQLNVTGSQILRTLLDGSTIDAAVTALTASHGIGQDRARADVGKLIDRLSRARLVAVS
ncbi:lasso peptide biosynthesis PqqD family chaperone [Nocardia terpenica]|uniref:lasso peptide biosynthesis PqqD family chaperone n=1 Tax=Nocardia terpenica TaxID=455432 RepID=UPI0018D5366C|nr:lasso peptide biosynthesis PqqD family chaperone [Nocardia terpenica]